jgi:hypothetical protein
MNLTAPTAGLVYRAIKDALAMHATGEFTGVSCLAVGADSIFARAVLDGGGQLEVILPAADYRQAKVKPDHADEFDELVGKAGSVRVMPFEISGRIAYEAANEALVSSCDLILAVWDGQEPRDTGGTAAVVQYARSRGVPVVVIWPEGALRS